MYSTPSQYLSKQLEGFQLTSRVENSVGSQQIRIYIVIREHNGSVVEFLTGDQRAAGSSLTGFTALCA